MNTADPQHHAKAVPGCNIPGTWRATCSCGWAGTLEGGRGSRRTALETAREHELDTEQRRSQVSP